MAFLSILLLLAGPFWPVECLCNKDENGFSQPAKKDFGMRDFGFGSTSELNIHN